MKIKLNKQMNNSYFYSTTTAIITSDSVFFLLLLLYYDWIYFTATQAHLIHIPGIWKSIHLVFLDVCCGTGTIGLCIAKVSITQIQFLTSENAAVISNALWYHYVEGWPWFRSEYYVSLLLEKFIANYAKTVCQWF